MDPDAGKEMTKGIDKNKKTVCVFVRPRPRTYCLADSDEESSSAGSSDEEDPTEVPEMPGTEG